MDNGIVKYRGNPTVLLDQRMVFQVSWIGNERLDSVASTTRPALLPFERCAGRGYPCSPDAGDVFAAPTLTAQRRLLRRL